MKYNPPDQVIPLRRRHKVIPKRRIGQYGALVVGAESADPQEVILYQLTFLWFGISFDLSDSFCLIL